MSYRSNPTSKMKTYTLFLDITILSLLVLAVYFQFTDYTLTDMATGRRGLLRMMVVTWQSLFVIATFCVFLRYVAGKMVRQQPDTDQL